MQASVVNQKVNSALDKKQEKRIELLTSVLKQNSLIYSVHKPPFC
jgi:hypothetical protein